MVAVVVVVVEEVVVEEVVEVDMRNMQNVLTQEELNELNALGGITNQAQQTTRALQLGKKVFERTGTSVRIKITRGSVATDLKEKIFKFLSELL